MATFTKNSSMYFCYYSWSLQLLLQSWKNNAKQKNTFASLQDSKCGISSMLQVHLKKMPFILCIIVHIQFKILYTSQGKNFRPNCWNRLERKGGAADDWRITIQSSENQSDLLPGSFWPYCKRLHSPFKKDQKREDRDLELPIRVLRRLGMATQDILRILNVARCRVFY